MALGFLLCNPNTEWGLRGFSTTVLKNDMGGSLLANGWRPPEEMKREIEDRLE